ncbi:FIG167255: hypothetical protein [hydrothermal vent metagenome]|uniref:Cellulase-like protein n=1 Tax=hydrothermal vent metagenome TaxID=652676 RepID=A0A3B0SEF8_9ZZZZ
MRNVFFILFLPLIVVTGAGYALPVLAQIERVPPVLSSKPGQKVILRGLDKVTASTHDFEVEVGSTTRFGSLTIQLSYCRKRPPEETPEVFAFLTITDRETDGSGEEIEGKQIFNGWMFASSPALNPLEHPVYDVWVLDCK